MNKPETLPAEEARKKFADVLDGTQFRSTHTEITRRGKPAGYVVPPEWYEQAIEALARKHPESSPPAVAAPRQQVTQAVRKPAPSISPKVAALPYERVKELADRARDRYPDWVDEVRQEYPYLRGPDFDLVIVELGIQKGFRVPELVEHADRPVSEEEAAKFAARARSKADETQLRKLEQLAGFAAEGSKDFAVMHAGLDMGLLTHDEVYAEPERPASEETTT